MAEIPDLRLRGDIAAHSAATVIFSNWIRFLSDRARAVAPR
jgi:hypothetical protein